METQNTERRTLTEKDRAYIKDQIEAMSIAEKDLSDELHRVMDQHITRCRNMEMPGTVVKFIIATTGYEFYRAAQESIKDPGAKEQLASRIKEIEARIQISLKNLKEAIDAQNKGN